jgi:O-antigen ligase
MGVEVVEPLHLKRAAGRPVPLDQLAKPRRGISTNALLGMGLWLLLWLGYNTGPWYVMAPGFPANTTDLIHGVRAFFPMLAAWFAALMIFDRSYRVFYWIMGPLGLMLLYAVTGLVSSATLSPEPIDSLYYGANYLAIVLVLLAIVSVENPLPDLRYVLRFTWAVGTIFMFSLLGIIPFLGSQVISETQTSPVGAIAYTRVVGIMGMAGSRNTGFARYAAISALVALPGFLRKGNLFVRFIWGILFTASLYALVVANGRTETLAFVGSVGVILVAERTKRTVNLLVATAAAILLGLRGFYSAFFLYLTRTGHVDLTLTGRTKIWEDGCRLLWQSPWVGFGFQADRYYLKWHLHNAFLHVLIQSGLLGGGAILIGLAIVGCYLTKYFILQPPSDKSLIPPEIPAVFLFVILSSVLQSTFAYFSATWLLSAPIVAYVLALHRHLQRARAKAAREKLRRIRLAKLSLQAAESHEGIEVAPPLAAGGAEH